MQRAARRFDRLPASKRCRVPEGEGFTLRAHAMDTAAQADTSRAYEKARCCVFDGLEVQANARAEKIA